MTPRIIVGILALVCVSVFSVQSSIASLQMVEEVNKKLSLDSQFGELVWYWQKTKRLHREYTRLCPSGQLLRKVYILWWLSTIGLLVIAWGFGVF
ncbi:MAG: hypothetical protein HYX25_04645 [Candidatus Solibacter usitatus]|nr:hypothetical protein [Candidatus Solibacter usitatus]